MSFGTAAQILTTPREVSLPPDPCRTPHGEDDDEIKSKSDVRTEKNINLNNKMSEK